MKNKNVYVIHDALFYYGFNHLLVYLSSYIKNAVDNNEVVYVSMKNEIYQKLLLQLKRNGIDLNKIHFCSVKPMISMYKEEGKCVFKKYLQDIILQEIKEGYKGVFWIGQPSFAVQETSKEDFLNWELELSEVFKNLEASLLCIYDMYENINSKKIIDDEVVKESLKTHVNILNELGLAEC